MVKEVENVLRKKTLDGLRELGLDIGPSFFRDLLETFEHDALKHITLMRSAAAGGETARLGREAHSLKGASLTVGAGGMADICAELERVEPQRCEEITSLALTRLQREFDLVQKEIELKKME
jgi:two-component system, sensor histidine kinase and response regulator